VVAMMPASATATEPVVSVRDLRVRFVTREGTVHAVNGVSFDLVPGEVLGILGESGSGKSVTLRALMGLLSGSRARVEGEIRVAGVDVGRLTEAETAALRGRTIAMIFQEPMLSLDPIYTIGEQIEETIIRHEGLSGRAARARALELLEMVQHRVVTVHASDRYLKPGHTLEELRSVEDSVGYAAILSHGVVGKGLNDYPRIFGILRQAGYQGWVSIEDGVNGLEEIRASAEFLRPLMQA